MSNHLKIWRKLSFRGQNLIFLSLALFSVFFLSVYSLGTFPPIIGFSESYTYYYTVSSRDYSPRGETVQRIVSRILGYRDSEFIKQVVDTIGAWVKKSRNPIPRQPNTAGGETSASLYRLARFSFENIGFNFLGLRIISSLSLVLFVLFFYLFVKNMFDVELAQYSTLVLLTFPVLFVFGRQYTIMAPSLFSLSFISWVLTVIEKRPTLIRLILFGASLSLMPYFYYFNRLILVGIFVYFFIFKFKVRIDSNRFLNYLPVIRLNPQFAIMLVVFIFMLALYSPLNIFYLINGEFFFPHRVEYATSFGEFGDSVLSNIRFLILSLTISPNDAEPIHLMNSIQNALILPILSPIFFLGVISQFKPRNMMQNLGKLGDIKYVYLLLIVGTLPALLSLTYATGTSMSTSRLSYSIVPIAIFAALGFSRIKDLLRRYITRERSRMIIFTFGAVCSIWSIVRNFEQFNYFETFLNGKIAGRSINKEFSPDVKSYTGMAYYHEPYSEQVYYLNLSKQIARTLTNEGDVILYLDRDRYIPATTNTHYWCFDYLKPFLSFYLAQQKFNVQYLEWYDDGPISWMPTAIRDEYSFQTGCAKRSANKTYEVKSFQKSDSPKIFLVTTKEDLDVARLMFKDRQVLSFTNPQL